MENILAVDDDHNILKVVKMRLEADGYRVYTAEQARKAERLTKDEVFDLALIDLKLNGDDGIELMERLHRVNPDMPVIILTAYGTIKSAVEAMRRGAYSYLTKPFDYDELLLKIKECLEKTELAKEIKYLRNMVKDRYGFENIIGRSSKMETVLEQVMNAASSNANVLIEGESGTGKELIAKTLHLAGSRKDRPYVAINCAAIPETLLESELLGYEQGAFTGATRNKKGLLRQAQGGTFVLDEISEMPLIMQAKLLRLIQEKEFIPLGGNKTLKLDTRFIATSNKNLEEEVQKGKFREDLFYRIHVIVIRIPPLRERKEDIPALANHFLKKISQGMDKKIARFSPSAMQKLMLHAWYGNVRELKNSIESAVAMANKNIISKDLILPAKDPKDQRLLPLKAAKGDFEKRYLLQLMELTQGNVAQAAKLAGKYRADLYALLKKHHIHASDFRNYVTNDG